MSSRLFLRTRQVFLRRTHYVRPFSFSNNQKIDLAQLCANLGIDPNVGKLPSPSGVNKEIWDKYVERFRDGLNNKNDLNGSTTTSEVNKRLTYSPPTRRWLPFDLPKGAPLQPGKVLTVISWNLECDEKYDMIPSIRTARCLQLIRREFKIKAAQSQSILMFQKVSKEALEVIKGSPWIRKRFSIAGTFSSDSSSSPPPNLPEDVMAREDFHRGEESYRTLILVPKVTPITNCFRVYRGNQGLQGQGVEYLVVDIPIQQTKTSSKNIRFVTSYSDLPYVGDVKYSSHLLKRSVGDVTNIFKQAKGHQQVVGGFASVDVGTQPGQCQGQLDEGPFNSQGEREKIVTIDKPLRIGHPVHFDIQVLDKHKPQQIHGFIFGKYNIQVGDKEKGWMNEKDIECMRLGWMPKYREEEGDDSTDTPIVPDWFLTSPARTRNVSTRITPAHAASLLQRRFLRGGVDAGGWTLTARINERVDDAGNHVHNYPGHISFVRVPI
ncbi:hypothetical protein QBC38DRAFT_487360 [Podospora fimiseda]|uniref:Uncharacterized protein n=1 Tax=Podospora fimiseda TaxID=252190 RepID=A0AAN7BHY5_9PEZI|nr:hypothetical protein QBC38DRAFT_487360 [Podospora fimiseda]